MHQDLITLIQRFRSAQVRAVQFLTSVCEIPHPASNLDWVARPTRGRLMELSDSHGVDLRKQGYGIEVQFSDLTIDFDWGDHWQANGFDGWRMINFATDNELECPFISDLEVEHLLADAHESGQLRKSGNLYYLVSEG